MNTMDRKAFMAGYFLKTAQPAQPAAYSPAWTQAKLEEGGATTPARGWNPEYLNFVTNKMRGTLPGKLTDPANPWAVPGVGAVGGAAIGGLLGGGEGAMIGTVLGSIVMWLAQTFFPGQVDWARNTVRDWAMKGTLSKNVQAYAEEAKKKGMSLEKTEEAALLEEASAIVEGLPNTQGQQRADAAKRLNTLLPAVAATSAGALSKEIASDQEIRAATGMGPEAPQSLVDAARKTITETAHARILAENRLEAAQIAGGAAPESLAKLQEDIDTANFGISDVKRKLKSGRIDMPSMQEAIMAANNDPVAIAGIQQAYRDMADVQQRRIQDVEGRYDESMERLKAAPSAQERAGYEQQIAQLRATGNDARADELQYMLDRYKMGFRGLSVSDPGQGLSLRPKDWDITGPYIQEKKREAGGPMVDPRGMTPGMMQYRPLSARALERLQSVSDVKTSELAADPRSQALARSIADRQEAGLFPIPPGEQQFMQQYQQAGGQVLPQRPAARAGRRAVSDVRPTPTAPATIAGEIGTPDYTSVVSPTQTTAQYAAEPAQIEPWLRKARRYREKMQALRSLQQPTPSTTPSKVAPDPAVKATPVDPATMSMREKLKHVFDVDAPTGKQVGEAAYPSSPTRGFGYMGDTIEKNKEQAAKAKALAKTYDETMSTKPNIPRTGS